MNVGAKFQRRGVNRSHVEIKIAPQWLCLFDCVDDVGLKIGIWAEGGRFDGAGGVVGDGFAVVIF